ncbi:MAG: aldo/keto reductase [Alphaproteobacteria bacterium]
MDAKQMAPLFPPLGLGTAPLGGLFSPVPDEQACAVIDAAWERGIRFFDTAPLYGHGASERRLGEVLRGRPRDDFVLATKVGRLLRRPAEPAAEDAYYKDTPPERPVFDFSHDGVMRSFEESLARLGLDRIDILHVHDPDAHEAEAISGALRALARLRAEGSIRAVGAGMNQWQMLARFAEAGAFDCFLLAGRYTLLDQSALPVLLPLCARRGIRIVAGGVYNSGLLADPRPGAKFNYDDAPAELVARARRLEAACRNHGVPLRAAAVQFPRFHDAVATVLAGARSVAELDDTLAMARVAIPATLWDEIRAEGLLPGDAPTPGRGTAS